MKHNIGEHDHVHDNIESYDGDEWPSHDNPAITLDPLSEDKQVEARDYYWNFIQNFLNVDSLSVEGFHSYQKHDHNWRRCEVCNDLNKAVEGKESQD